MGQANRDFAPGGHGQPLMLVMQIIEAGKGTKNLLSTYIPNTSERFKSAVSFIKEHATTPGTPLLLSTVDGIEVVDGNHRVAALLATQS